MPYACSTGWITTWGESMANTSVDLMMQTLTDIVSYENSTGSVNLYMAHGGTNFGYWAGLTLDKVQLGPIALLSLAANECDIGSSFAMTYSFSMCRCQLEVSRPNP